MLIIKKKLKKMNLRVRFLALKIAFFGGFENDNILSSKSYTVKKSGIYPQQKPVGACACTDLYEIYLMSSSFKFCKTPRFH